MSSQQPSRPTSNGNNASTTGSAHSLPDDVSGDYFLKVIDVSLDARSRTVHGESAILSQIELLLKNLPPVPEKTARLYFTHNIDKLDSFNFKSDIRSAFEPPELPQLSDPIWAFAHADYDVPPAGHHSGLPAFPWDVAKEAIDYDPNGIGDLQTLWQNPNGQGRRLVTQRFMFKLDQHFNSEILTKSVRPLKLVRSITWTSVALMDDDRVIVLCPTRGKDTDLLFGECRFGTIEEIEARIQRVLSPSATISFSNGDRSRFLQLLLVDILQVNSMLSDRVIRLMLGFAPKLEHWHAAKTATEHMLRMQTYEKMLSMTEDTSRSIDYISMRLYRDTTSAAGATSSAPGSSNSTQIPSALKYSLEDISNASSEAIILARRLIDQASREFHTVKELRDADQHFRTYWLTILATIFLPLSLATSMLSMQTRLSDLGYLIYDFFGIAVLIGTLIVLVAPFMRGYFAIEALLRRVIRMESAAEEPNKFENETLLSPNDELAKKTVKRRAWKRRSVIAVVKSPVYAWWMLTLASFLVGMIWNTGLGLKILGFGSAGFAGLALILVLPIGAIEGFAEYQVHGTRKHVGEIRKIINGVRQNTATPQQSGTKQDV